MTMRPSKAAMARLPATTLQLGFTFVQPRRLAENWKLGREEHAAAFKLSLNATAYESSTYPVKGKAAPRTVGSEMIPSQDRVKSFLVLDIRSGCVRLHTLVPFQLQPIRGAANVTCFNP